MSKQLCNGEGGLIALDWGTTNVRLALLDNGGEVVESGAVNPA